MLKPGLFALDIVEFIALVGVGWLSKHDYRYRECQW